jgi:large subunit ribosomal protein L23
MNNERIYQVIQAPVVSEKAIRIGEESNQYVFSVLANATKREIKQAVEAVFSVTVEAVNTSVVKGKSKQNRHGKVIKSDWKKAFVKLASGHTIDLTNI